jgi:hypothetical protein
MTIAKRALAMLLPALMAGRAAAEEGRAARWWSDVSEVASDANEGRLTGAPGHLRAADYVESRFRAIGLAPAGDDAFRQQVRLEEQIVDYPASRAELLTADGATAPVALGAEMIVATGLAPRPAAIEAPLVFIGYGLHLPQAGHDDFAGVDLKGKVAVVIAGGPPHLAAALKAANRSQRPKLLGEAGAVGVIMLTPPGQIEIPWARQRLLARQGGMYLADRELRDVPDGFLMASFDPAASERLFAGSGHSFAEVAAGSDASQQIAGFALPVRLRASLAIRRRTLTSPNLVARLEGADPALALEHVVVSAHLDHVGVGPAVDGDTIYNGALDDGSGVASVLDIAQVLASGPRPKRSVLFLVTTAEEPGLLGSSYFAKRPTVPRERLVANLNFDTLTPLWPLTSILAQGDLESTLGDTARQVAARRGLTLVPDPLPNRNSFVRTDQFSFVRAGVPALSLKFGFTPGSEAFRIEHDWRANRYHAPSDDIAQPGVQPGQAIALDDYSIELLRAIADAPTRPKWNPTSAFRPAEEAPVARR